jgi:Kef-type K+ transport system membrane component KefB
MRRDIFGLGLAQVLAGMALLSTVGWALGYPFATSLIAGTGFVLTSTAIVMQMLAERNEIARAKGQRIVSVLLLEDLAIVPLLALVAFLAPGGAEPVTAGRAPPGRRGGASSPSRPWSSRAASSSTPSSSGSRSGAGAR